MATLPLGQCDATGTNSVPSEVNTSPHAAINSSTPRRIGRHARAFRRKGNKYILPCSPESPTLQMQKRRKTNPKRVQDISGCLQARHSAQYSLTQVEKLRVEAFQAVQVGPPSRSQSISLSSWSPTFPVAEAGINLQLAPTFNPSENHISSFSQLLRLDTLPALGLVEDEFWKLFSRCAACHNFMTTRTIPYHICPSSAETNRKFDVGNIPKTYFLRLLDVHDTDHEAGVPEEIFRAIFYICGQCRRYMTKRISVNHNEEANCDMDDEELTVLQSACTESLFNTCKFQEVRTLKEFPILELL